MASGQQWRGIAFVLNLLVATGLAFMVCMSEFRVYGVL